MARTPKSPVAGIVNFFRSAELHAVSLVLDLCKDAVRERQTKSAKAKARAGVDKGEPPMRRKLRQRHTAKPSAVAV